MVVIFIRWQSISACALPGRRKAMWLVPSASQETRYLSSSFAWKNFRQRSTSRSTRGQPPIPYYALLSPSAVVPLPVAKLANGYNQECYNLIILLWLLISARSSHFRHPSVSNPLLYWVKSQQYSRDGHNIFRSVWDKTEIVTSGGQKQRFPKLKYSWVSLELERLLAVRVSYNI